AAGGRDLLHQRLDVGAQEFRRRMTGVADEMKVPGMAVRRFVARPTLAEIDFPRDARVDHPLQCAVDGGAPDPGRLPADGLEQVVGADVPLLAKEHFDDLVALGRPLAALRTQRGEIGKVTVHAGELATWRPGELTHHSTTSPTRQPVIAIVSRRRT